MYNLFQSGRQFSRTHFAICRAAIWAQEHPDKTMLYAVGDKKRAKMLRTQYKLLLKAVPNLTIKSAEEIRNGAEITMAGLSELKRNLGME